MKKVFELGDIIYAGGYCGRVIRLVPHPYPGSTVISEIEIETLYADPKKPNIIKTISMGGVTLLSEEISYLRNRADKLEKILNRV